MKVMKDTNQIMGFAERHALPSNFRLIPSTKGCGFGDDTAPGIPARMR